MMMGIMEMVVHMVHSAIPIMIRLEVVIHIQVIIVKERIISVQIVMHICIYIELVRMVMYIRGAMINSVEYFIGYNIQAGVNDRIH